MDPLFVCVVCSGSYFDFSCDDPHRQQRNESRSMLPIGQDSSNAGENRWRQRVRGVLISH